jgi:hypothetical protein
MARRSKAKPITQTEEPVMQEQIETQTPNIVNEGIQETGTISESTTSNVGEVKQETVVNVIVEAPKVSEPVTKEAGDLDYLDKAYKTNNVAVKMALDDIVEYMETMKPGKAMTSIEGAKRQAKLYYAIRNIIEHSGDAFNVAFTALLKIVEKNDHSNGVFYDTYVMRFVENLALTTNDIQAFRRIINLLKILAPVKGRTDAAKQVSFTKSLQFGLTDEGRQRILTYFNV